MISLKVKLYFNDPYKSFDVINNFSKLRIGSN